VPPLTLAAGPRALVTQPLRPYALLIPRRLLLGLQEVLTVLWAGHSSVYLRGPHRHHQQVDPDLPVDDHGDDPPVLVGAVRFPLDALPAEQGVEVFPGRFLVRLARVVPVGALGRVDAQVIQNALLRARPAPSPTSLPADTRMVSEDYPCKWAVAQRRLLLRRNPSALYGIIPVLPDCEGVSLVT